MQRYLAPQIELDLQKKMVFLGGPRQVGKTTLSEQIRKSMDGQYFNWDDDEDRARLLERDFDPQGMIVFDEIHKFRRWRNWLKGLYDKNKSHSRYLVTGSARLDFYRFGGDSLQGRYHYLRLHPFSVAELKMKSNKNFEDLVNLGGFPEPFLSGSLDEARRWSREYRARLIRDDIQSIELLQDLAGVEQLLIRLPQLVGSPLSINNLREDLGLAHKTVAKWLEVLERFYAIFRISPFGSPKIQAVKKEQKHYHFDWSVVKEPSLRFENVIASHLLKWCHFIEDTKGIDCELRFFRDRNGREVDFVIVEDGSPMIFVECKWSVTAPSKELQYLKAKFPTAKAYQVHCLGHEDRMTTESIRILPAVTFLQQFV